MTCFKDLDPQNIIGHGEFSYYVDNVLKDPSVPYVGMRDAADFFKIAVTPKTFLNPANLQIFFESYKANNFAPIMKRFNMNNLNQIHAMKGYFDMIV